MNYFSAAIFFTYAIQLFCALAGGLTAYFVMDILEPMVMTALMRPRLSFPRAQILRFGTFAAFALLVFFLVGEVGPGGAKGRGYGDGETRPGAAGKSGADSVASVPAGEATELKSKIPPKEFRVRVLSPESAAKYPGSKGEIRRLFLVWDGGKPGPDLLDFHETRERVDAWKKTLSTGTDPRVSLIYTNDDPDDTAPIVVGFSRFLRDGGVELERRTASDAETFVPVATNP